MTWMTSLSVILEIQLPVGWGSFRFDKGTLGDNFLAGQGDTILVDL